MSDGQFVIVGDCDFIKEKFSVGYHVVLTFKGDNMKKVMN